MRQGEEKEKTSAKVCGVTDWTAGYAQRSAMS